MNTQKELETLSYYVLNSDFKIEELSKIIEDLNTLIIMSKVNARKSSESAGYIGSKEWKDSYSTRDFKKLQLIKIIAEL
jgi:hypothetical protein